MKTPRLPDQLVIGWRVNPGLDPEYWMRPDAAPGQYAQEDLVSVRRASVAKHAAVIAQSGSGKSFFLGRLIEEIALKTRARLVVFDPNSDFRRLRDALPADAWSSENIRYDYKKRSGWLSDETTAADFLDAWLEIPIAVHTATRTKQNPYRPLKLWWPSIPVEFLQEDVDSIGRNDMYHCHVFVQTLARLYQESSTRDHGNLLENARDLLRLSRQMNSPSEFRKHLDTLFPDSQTSSKPSVLTIPLALNILGLTVPLTKSKNASTLMLIKNALVNASAFVSEGIERFYFGRAYRTDDSGILNLGIHEGDSYTGTSARVEIIDLPSLKDRSVQILAASTLLEVEWNNARRRWGDALQKAPKEDDRVPTLIVVDEAHNLMPKETHGTGETALREQFRRIAAEGRKYGLFLVLVSQRPDKLDRLVLSECENKVLMRLGSVSVLRITREILGLEEIPEKTLSKCLEFETGRGLLLGEWAQGRPTYFYCAARRTVEGGRNLRPDAWAVAPTPKTNPTPADPTGQVKKGHVTPLKTNEPPIPKEKTGLLSPKAPPKHTE